MTIGIGPTATWMLQNQPFQVSNPYGPAGITDMTRQGWLTQLQGMGSQFGPALQYAQGMGGLNRYGQQAFLGGLESGAFSSNPWMQQAAAMAGRGGMNPGFGAGMNMLYNAPNQPTLGQAAGMYGNLPGGGYFGEAAGGFRGAGQQPGFRQGAQMATGAPNQPGFGQAAAGAQNVMGQYGGGWSGDLASDINRVGASFDPFDNPALDDAIQRANQRLGQDFREGTLRNLNQSAAGAGPGAFGGTRAGVAQGIAERGLADAMAQQTGDMLSRGYEAGLNRYVQDRASTLGTTMDALRQGSQTGLAGSRLLGDLAGRMGNLQLGAGRTLADIARAQGGLGLQGAQGLAGMGGTMGNLGLGAAGGLANLGLGQGRLGVSAGTGLGNLAAQQGGQYLQGAGLLGGLGQNALNQQNQMFRFGFGQMLPGMMTQAYQAGMAPGNVMQGMGQAMAGMGGAQQQANQAMLDWYNSQAAQRQAWPWEQFGRYQAAVSPITALPGQQTTTTASGPGANPWAAGAQGAATGLGLWNLWNQQQGNGQVPGDAYLPGTLPR